MLKDETKNAINELMKLYPEKRSALIPALHLAQAEKGYLPKDVQAEVAVLFAIEPSEVLAIVSFYDMFYEKPVGKKVVHICKNLSCMLRGSDELLEKICTRLKINPGETTADGEFTLLKSECLAACDLAPVLQVNDELIGCVQDVHLDEILGEKGKG